MWILALMNLSWAVRPTSGGLFAFDSADVIQTYDEGMIRVHYSSAGPNVTMMDDLDLSGHPDFVEQVARASNDVLDFYADMGFAYPLSESDMGLSALGGNNAFDFYLVDFGGSSDGMFGIDACDGSRCSGYMVMENDFRGYGYPNIAEAVDVLTSHELFHAVQAAYNASQPSWLSEGSAVWAEWAYNPDVMDFIWFAAAYLEETDRSIYRPPAGVTTSFSYGTGLFFAFMDEYYGEERMVSIQESLVDVSEDEAIFVIMDHMDDVSTDWMTFSQWNLATNIRSGSMDSYSFAARLFGLETEAEGALIAEDHRFYPLATTYFVLEHSGNAAVNFVYEGEDTDVTFSLHAEDDSDNTLPALKTWTIGEEPVFTLDLEAGNYWLIGSLPNWAENSQKVEFCFGADCELPVVQDPVVEEDTTKQGCQTLPWEPSVFMLWSLMMLRRRDQSVG